MWKVNKKNWCVYVGTSTTHRGYSYIVTRQEGRSSILFLELRIVVFSALQVSLVFHWFHWCFTGVSLALLGSLNALLSCREKERKMLQRSVCHLVDSGEKQC